MPLPIHTCHYNHSHNNTCCSVKVKDFKDARELIRRRFTGGKTLMLVGRDCVLDDTLHYMTKEGFDPTRPITVKDKNHYVCTCEHYCKTHLSSL